MQAYIYIRFSTPKQERGDSERRQLEDCERFCERQGWTVIDRIKDLGRSAWTGAHLTEGNLGRFRERVRRGEIAAGSVLVVEKLDRLSRQDVRTAQRWIEDLCAEGLSIATTDGGRMFTEQVLRADPLAVFEILFRAQLANDESRQKSERVLARIGANMEKAKVSGRVITAKAPGWLKMRPDRSGFDEIKERGAIVRLIYSMAAEGKGARWIAKELNERAVAAWGYRREGKPAPTWEITSVALLLKQPSVEGDYVPGFANTSASRTKFSERIVGYYPRVVDADLVARARAAVTARKIGGGRHTRNVANLFAGMVVCGECGNKMHLRSNGDKNPQRHWQCNYASRSRGCSQKQMFRYSPFEKSALDAVLHLALDNRFFANADRMADLVRQLAESDKRLADAKEQARRLANILARQDSPAIEDKLAEVERGRRDLEAERQRAADDLQAARGAVPPAAHLQRVRELRHALNDPNPETRQDARLRVQTAFRDLGARVVCEIDEDDGQRVIRLLLESGVLTLVFDNGGAALFRSFDPGLEVVETRFADLVPGPFRLEGSELEQSLRQIELSEEPNASEN